MADREECVDVSCAAPVKPEHVVHAAALGSDHEHGASGQYGAKLTQVKRAHCRVLGRCSQISEWFICVDCGSSGSSGETRRPCPNLCPVP